MNLSPGRIASNSVSHGGSSRAKGISPHTHMILWKRQRLRVLQSHPVIISSHLEAF